MSWTLRCYIWNTTISCWSFLSSDNRWFKLKIMIIVVISTLLTIVAYIFRATPRLLVTQLEARWARRSKSVCSNPTESLMCSFSQIFVFYISSWLYPQFLQTNEAQYTLKVILSDLQEHLFKGMLITSI